MDQKSEYGLKVFGEIMGAERAAALRQSAGSTAFAAPVGQMAIDFAFASVWGRPGMERGKRSLITLAILVATRQTLELKNHVRIGVANGLGVRDFEELLIQCVPYLGFPAVASATTAVLETLRELGLDTESKTSEERGLL
jgi:4-carboxymuconolactone decarboxylase